MLFRSKQSTVIASRLHDAVVLILGDGRNKLMNTFGGILEYFRLAVLIRRISYDKSVLADVNTNVSHNKCIVNKYATSKHLGTIIANAGSKPSELSGFGC